MNNSNNNQGNTGGPNNNGGGSNTHPPKDLKDQADDIENMLVKMTNSNASKVGSAAGADSSSMHSSMLGSRVAGQPGGQPPSVAVKSEGLPVGGHLSVKSADTSGPTGSVGAREKPS